MNKYIRHDIYDIEFILENFITEDKVVKDLDGVKVKTNSQRYLTFKQSGTNCVKCGIEGRFFALEKCVFANIESDKYHFNLYATKDGKEVMLTKDHIQPKSKGGRNILSNYVILCYDCNQEKGSN